MVSYYILMDYLLKALAITLGISTGLLISLYIFILTAGLFAKINKK